jgi:predicted MPP superfamily phosphohydrolase
MSKTQPNRKKSAKRVLLSILAALVFLLLVSHFQNHLTAVFYTVSDDKIQVPVKIALIADLHSCRYGEGQSELIRELEVQNPDAVFLGGDILDDRMPHQGAMELLQVIGRRYPCFYVSGNHEYWSGEIESIKKLVRGCGIPVLEGDVVSLDIGGNKISLGGIDDFEAGISVVHRQLEQIAAQKDTSRYSILLAHRPEAIETYLSYGFDLILSGHAHGGQWRIPGLINGIAAPNQGFFPKYAGGEYRFPDEGTVFIVSRGLARESSRIPRIFNPPELVFIELRPS